MSDNPRDCVRCGHPGPKHYNRTNRRSRDGYIAQPCHYADHRDLRCSCRDYLPQPGPPPRPELTLIRGGAADERREET